VRNFAETYQEPQKFLIILLRQPASKRAKQCYDKKINLIE